MSKFIERRKLRKSVDKFLLTGSTTDGNKFTKWILNPARIKKIDLRKKNLASLDLARLIVCHELESLDLSKNSLKTLDLKNLTETSLSILNLSQNCLKTLNLIPLRNLHLKSLDLRKNRIKILDITPLIRNDHLKSFEIDKSTTLVVSNYSSPSTSYGYPLRNAIQKYYSNIQWGKINKSILNLLREEIKPFVPEKGFISIDALSEIIGYDSDIIQASFANYSPIKVIYDVSKIIPKSKFVLTNSYVKEAQEIINKMVQDQGVVSPDDILKEFFNEEYDFPIFPIIEEIQGVYVIKISEEATNNNDYGYYGETKVCTAKYLEKLILDNLHDWRGRASVESTAERFDLSVDDIFSLIKSSNDIRVSFDKTEIFDINSVKSEILGFVEVEGMVPRRGSLSYNLGISVEDLKVFLPQISKIIVSETGIFSKDYLQEMIFTDLVRAGAIEILSHKCSLDYHIPKGELISLVESKGEVTLSTDGKKLFLSDRIKDWILGELVENGYVDLTNYTQQLSLKLADVLPLLEDPWLVIDEANFLMYNRDWLTLKLTDTLLKDGRVFFDTFSPDQDIKGIISSEFLCELALKTNVPGILTGDKKSFLTFDFLSNALQEDRMLYTDISYEKVAKAFQIPSKYVKEILIKSIKAGVLGGKLIPREKRFLFQEKAFPPLKKSTNKIPEFYNCLECGKRIKDTELKCPYCKVPQITCEICRQRIVFGDEKGNCPYCDHTFHREHLLENMKMYGKCPNPFCGHKLTKTDIDLLE